MGNLRYTNLASEGTNEDALAQLALDLRWSWNHSTDELWQRLNPELWDLTHNPWIVLQTVSRERLESVSSDPAFQSLLSEVTQAQQNEREQPTWFQHTHSNSPLKTIAYFSMEYMLSESLPIYSGGLGNVAGDQLKAAHDLGVPVIGVGLLYQQGYFRQQIDENGNQIALYPFNDPGQLPIKPLRDKNGDWLRIALRMPDYSLWLRTWEVQVGRRKLYLLDTNDPANLPEHRGIASELYGGGPDLRLRQELVLGIGGWRLLRALGIEPEVCHLNEGHAAFAVLERARSYMDDTGQPFEVALAVTRAGNLFTTHTPVEAGFDRFSEDMMRPFFSWYASERVRIPFRDLMALGRRNPDDSGEPFNMAYLAIRGSGAVNGVSRLHGEVSRKLFEPLFPRWPEAEIPVRYVTNGVHMPTWDSAEADRLWTDCCGKKRWLGDLQKMQESIRSADDAALWRVRTDGRKALVEYVRKRSARQAAGEGGSAQQIDEAGRIFDPNTLTLGFARRFAPYKRPTLLLHDTERLKRILTNAQRPVQLVLAGKAHPADGSGKAMIRAWTDFIRRAGPQSHVVFLSDYDMLMTEQLVNGVDVWINTPRRPWEASGTSGMKVLVNGGLNLSELDGWWAEAYTPEVGWALGDGKEHGDDPAWDASEAESLYEIIENQIAHEFYAREQDGIPKRWVARMRESIARLTPQFSAHRTVREYTERHYVPAAEAYTQRAAEGGKLGADVANWQANLARHWQNVRFGSVKVERHDAELAFEAVVYPGALDPNAIGVELFANGAQEPLRLPMNRGAKVDGDGYIYWARTPSDRNADDFTARVVPHHPSATVPLEASRILWQK
jgi:starch phosphorylase